MSCMKLTLKTSFIAGLMATATLLLSCEGFRFHHDASTQLDGVRERGNYFLSAGMGDSAISCYNAVVGQYYRRMNDKEKNVIAKAYNNRGYVYFYLFNDFVQAYDDYLHALDIYNMAGHGSSATLLNIGNLYGEYDSGGKAMDYWRQAFTTAVHDSNLSIAVIAFGHLLSGSVSLAGGIGIHTLDSICRVYQQLNIPDSIPLVHYTASLLNGYHAYRQRHYQEAAQWFLKASRHPDTPDTPERYVQEALDLAMNMYDKMGEWDSGLRLAEEGMRSNGSIPPDLLINYYQSKAYFSRRLGMTDSANLAMLRAYEIEDSLLNPRSFTRIQDLKVMYGLKKKDEAIAMERMRRTAREITLTVVLMAAVVIIILLYKYYRKSLRQRQMLEELYHKAKEQAEHPLRPKRPSSPDMQQAEDIYNKVESVMQTSREIFSPDFTADRLAELSGYKPRQVSQAISAVADKNFNTLLGEYRVREACRRMADPAFHHLTYAAIAEGVGFRSRTNFVAVFKRVTGLTPTEYVRMSRKADA